MSEIRTQDDLPLPPGWKPESKLAPHEKDLHGTGLSTNDLAWLFAYPHLLGNMVGKTKLTMLHSEMILDLWYRRPGIHTSLMAHRGAYKTTGPTEVGTAHWFFTGHIDDRIALVRENSQVASASLSTIIRIMQHDFYRACFLAANGVLPDMKIARGDAMLLACKPSITKEHNIQAAGIETIKTGDHFDIIHCDDIVTLEDRLSRAKRERTIQGVIEVKTNIIDPGKTVHFVGTPWHPDDAWKFCSVEGTDAPTKKYDVYSTGIFTPEQIEEKRKYTTPSLWAANMELRHQADESSLFKERAYVEPWSWAHPYQAYAHLDAKFSGDHTNALTIMSKLQDGRIQIYGRVFHENVKDIFPDIRRICVRYKVKKLYNEQNPDKGFVADELEKKDRIHDLPAITIGSGLYGGRYTERMNKHVKISTYGLKWWDKLVWAPDCDEEYITQVLDYMEGQQPDDAPDSMASLLREHFDDGKMGSLALYE